MAARKVPQDRRSPRSRPTGLVAVPMPPVLEQGVPEPDDWLSETVEEWGVFWRSDIANPIVETDLPALRRLFGMRDMRRQHEIALDATGPLTEGSQGQLVANPILRMIADLDGRILALEDRFFLVPSSRIKAGVSVANAKSNAALANSKIGAARSAARAARPDPRLQRPDADLAESESG